MGKNNQFEQISGKESNGHSPQNIELLSLDILMLALETNLSRVHAYLREGKYQLALQELAYCDAECKKSQQSITQLINIQQSNKIEEPQHFSLLKIWLEDTEYFQKTFLKQYAENLWKLGEHEEAIPYYIAIAEADISRLKPAKTLLVTRLKEYADHVANQLIEKSKSEKDQKTYLLEALKKTSPYIKLYLLKQALQIDTPLGAIFWEKRGLADPSLEQGTLKKIVEEIARINIYRRTEECEKGEYIAATSYIKDGIVAVQAGVETEEKLSPSAYDFYQIAIAEFDRAIYLDPKAKSTKLQIKKINFPEENAFYYRGDVYLKLNEFEKALEDANRSIEINPLSQNAYTLKLNVLIQLNKFDDAAYVDQLINIVFSDELQKAKDKKQFLFDKISTYADSIQLRMLHEACDNTSILGAVLLENDKDGKILKEIHAKIKKLDPSFAPPQPVKQKEKPVKNVIQPLAKVDQIKPEPSNANDAPQKGFFDSLINKKKKQPIAKVSSKEDKERSTPVTNAVAKFFYTDPSKISANFDANEKVEHGKGNRLSYSSGEGL